VGERPERRDQARAAVVRESRCGFDQCSVSDPSGPKSKSMPTS